MAQIIKKTQINFSNVLIFYTYVVLKILQSKSKAKVTKFIFTVNTTKELPSIKLVILLHYSIMALYNCIALS